MWTIPALVGLWLLGSVTVASLLYAHGERETTDDWTAGPRRTDAPDPGTGDPPPPPRSQ